MKGQEEKEKGGSGGVGARVGAAVVCTVVFAVCWDITVVLVQSIDPGDVRLHVTSRH